MSLLGQVQESFELNHETLYTAVKMTDLYLSKKQVSSTGTVPTLLDLFYNMLIELDPNHDVNKSK